MLSIFQFLKSNSATAVVNSGIIRNYAGQNKYVVAVNGQEFLIPSAVEEQFTVGSRVLIVQMDSQRYLIGHTGQVSTDQRKEIIVDA
jgi:hypothetical protein